MGSCFISDCSSKHMICLHSSQSIERMGYRDCQSTAVQRDWTSKDIVGKQYSLPYERSTTHKQPQTIHVFGRHLQACFPLPIPGTFHFCSTIPSFHNNLMRTLRSVGKIRHLLCCKRPTRPQNFPDTVDIDWAVEMDLGQ